MKKYFKTMIFTLLLVLSISFTTEAKTLKLNVTSKKLNVGMTSMLKVNSNKKNIKWKTSNKKIVKLLKTKGNKIKIKANKPGKAKITCQVGKIKKTCTITVSKNKTYSYKECLKLIESDLKAKGYQNMLEYKQKLWKEGFYNNAYVQKDGKYVLLYPTYESIMEEAPGFGSSYSEWTIDPKNPSITVNHIDFILDSLWIDLYNIEYIETTKNGYRIRIYRGESVEHYNKYKYDPDNY